MQLLQNFLLEKNSQRLVGKTFINRNGVDTSTIDHRMNNQLLLATSLEAVPTNV